MATKIDLKFLQFSKLCDRIYLVRLYLCENGGKTRMFIDLSHNYVVKNTITEKFSESLEKKLLPRLAAKYGADLLGIQMYEDYISDAFYARGEWYYPLTVITATGPAVEWIKWRMKTGNFEAGVPYAYVGEGILDINLAETVPGEFAGKISGRSICPYGSAMKVNIETSAKDPTFLSGRYSQSFVDEMARQLTEKISSAMGVSGLEKSTVSLSLVFAPGTYMEHTSENVTYRRLLIADNASAPRDFWVKWTREDGAMAYSVSDHVNPETIVFEIGEDVPKKVMEKEYRFLITAGGDKYHNAMGRKNITEWRELIKRAVRRGELIKIDIPVNSEADEDVNARIAAVLGKTQINTAPAETPVAKENDDFARAMELARSIIAERDAEYDAANHVTEPAPVYAAEPAPVYAAEPAPVHAAEPAPVYTAPAAASEAVTEISFAAEPKETAFAPAYTPAITEDAATVELFEEIDDEESLEDEESVRELEILDAAPASEPVNEAQKTLSYEEMEAQIRAEVEAKVRLQYEILARREAEAEAEKHRLEAEELRRQNQKLLEEAEAERIRLAKIAEERRAEDARMRAELEDQLRREAAERERLAQAAREEEERRAREAAERAAEAERLAVERRAAEARRIAEEQRLAEERRLAEARRIAEEQRLAEARRLAEEQKRAEEARLAEERRMAEEKRRAEEARIAEEKRRAEEAARREAEEKERRRKEAEAIEGHAKTKNYTYTSKSVKLLFRRTVDPNMTSRIYEIIKTTLEYYGKDKMYMRIKATIPDTTTVILEFVEIPMEEMALLSNIIKVLGNSGLGIAKAIVE